MRELSPPRIEPIFSDKRGASYSLVFPDLGAEMVLIYTNAGFYRGGHSHDFPETSVVLTGRVKYWKQFPDGREIEFEHGAGEPLFNAAGENHLALFMEDSWVADWKIGAKKGQAVTTDYLPYRAKVREQLHL